MAQNAPKTEAERLVAARIRRGIGTAKDTAEFFGWTYNTYIQHERGERGLRKPVAEKYAKGLRVSVSWLLTGEGDPGWKVGQAAVDEGQITVDRSLLKQAVMFVLIAEGVPEDRAALIADIFPEALSGPPVDVVERDPFLSFQVHLQFRERSGHPTPR